MLRVEAYRSRKTAHQARRMRRMAHTLVVARRVTPLVPMIRDQASLIRLAHIGIRKRERKEFLPTRSDRSESV